MIFAVNILRLLQFKINNSTCIKMKKIRGFLKGAKGSSKDEKESSSKPLSKDMKLQKVPPGFTEGACALPEGEEIPVSTMSEREVYQSMNAARDILVQVGDLSERHMFQLREKILLLAESGNESKIYTHGVSLLCECITHDRMEALEVLVDLGINVNSSSHTTKSRNLPLHVACSFGKVEYVSFLLEKGAYPANTCELTIKPNGESRSCESDNLDAFEFALENDNINVLQILLKYPSSRTLVSSFLLHKACKMGATECVKLIHREFPEQIKTVDSGGHTALRHAFWRQPSIAMFLAEKCPDVLDEITPENSYKKLLKVCSVSSYHLGSYEREDAIRFLLKYGDCSLLSHADDDGNTPLHHLCLLCGQSSYHLDGLSQKQEDYDRNLLSSIRLLAEAGADLNVKNTVGYPPIMELLSNKPQRKLYQRFYTTCFLEIAYSGVSRAMDVLLDCGASMTIDDYIHPFTKLANIAEHLETTALHAAHPYMKDMIATMLDKGCSPDLQTCMGWPVVLLFMAAYLSRDPKYAFLDLANDFDETMDIFLAHNASFGECTLKTSMTKRDSNICQEFIYIIMQDIRHIGTVRLKVIKCFDKVLDVIKKQKNKMDMSNPVIPERKTLSATINRNIDYKGGMDFARFCLYIYSNGRDTAQEELLVVLAKLSDVVEKEDDVDFKHKILKAAKTQNTPSSIQHELESAFLKF